MFGSIGGRVVLDNPAILACQHSTRFIGITCHHVRYHLFIHGCRDMHDKCFITGYHKIFASKSSSSSSNSRVHRSSLRYFQPPSARITTIFPLSRLPPPPTSASEVARQEGCA